MQPVACLCVLVLVHSASAVIHVRNMHSEQACVVEDLKRRALVQNKLADQCEDMCKNVGKYPDCQCPGFVAPDSTPGVMTWDELREHLRSLSSWGQDTSKQWHAQVSLVQKFQHVIAKTAQEEQACVAEELKHRAQFQNTLADTCEDMCKNVGKYPDCQCPGFVAPDSTPNVMTWDELLTHMDNLQNWGQDTLKGWHAQASMLLVQKGNLAVRNVQSEQACVAEDLKRRALFQNKLADQCEDMCKNVGKYPDCKCPGFVAPDSTPGVMTWDELREHLRNLSSWGKDTSKQWHAQASLVQKLQHVIGKSAQEEQACVSEDLKHRTQFQNTLADTCEDMCKNVGKYPDCQCPGFVAPDSTPNVMTWDELLTHMDNLQNWGHDTLKGWRAQASMLLVQNGKRALRNVQSEQSCVAEDLKRRALFQNKLADQCEDMCKNVGKYPDCQCPGFVAPDSTPGVMTWDELREHLRNLSSWGKDTSKQWHAQASLLQKLQHVIGKSAQEEQACVSEDLKHRVQFQNTLADTCEDMCKNVGKYPDCQCPGFVAPDSTPNVMTWDELLTHMDNLQNWGQDTLKDWHAQAH